MGKARWIGFSIGALVGASLGLQPLFTGGWGPWSNLCMYLTATNGDLGGLGCAFMGVVGFPLLGGIAGALIARRVAKPTPAA